MNRNLDEKVEIKIEDHTDKTCIQRLKECSSALLPPTPNKNRFSERKF